MNFANVYFCRLPIEDRQMFIKCLIVQVEMLVKRDPKCFCQTSGFYEGIYYQNTVHLITAKKTSKRSLDLSFTVIEFELIHKYKHLIANIVHYPDMQETLPCCLLSAAEVLPKLMYSYVSSA